MGDEMSAVSVWCVQMTCASATEYRILGTPYMDSEDFLFADLADGGEVAVRRDCIQWWTVKPE